MFIFIYLFGMNLLSFSLFYLDKRRAKKHQWRIKEATLLFVCLFGGALGGWLSMYCFHHKTKKWYFKFGVPLMLILQVFLAYYLRHRVG